MIEEQKNNELIAVKESRVNWQISGTYDCPECGEEHDFMEIDEFYVFSNVGENVDKFFRPINVTCKKCGKDFNIVGADY